MSSLIFDNKRNRVSRVWCRPKLLVFCVFCTEPVRVRMKLCMNRPLRARTVGGVGAGS